MIVTGVLEAAKGRPSGCMFSPGVFIVVRDEKIRKEICQICGKQAIYSGSAGYDCLFRRPEPVFVRGNEEPMD